MFDRHIRRCQLLQKVVVIRGYSAQMDEHLPVSLDFVFVDGDHSWDGISADWKIVKKRLSKGGIVCLHDTSVPPEEPWRTPDSVRFFDEVIANDTEFQHVETVYSLNVLVRSKDGL